MKTKEVVYNNVKIVVFDDSSIDSAIDETIEMGDTEVIDTVYVYKGWNFYSLHTHTEFKFHCDYYGGYFGANTMEEMFSFINKERGETELF